MIIRLATGLDLARLVEIYEQSVQVLGPALYTPEQVTAWAESAHGEDFPAFALGPETYVVVDEEDVALGFCGVEPNGHVASLYVAPEAGRRGIGSALLNHVMAVAEARGIRRLYAEASFFSKDVFLRAGFSVEEMETVKRNGVLFDRYKVARVSRSAAASARVVQSGA